MAGKEKSVGRKSALNWINNLFAGDFTTSKQNPNNCILTLEKQALFHGMCISKQGAFEYLAWAYSVTDCLTQRCHLFGVICHQEIASNNISQTVTMPIVHIS